MPVTVLCVDDHAHSLLSRTAILERHGYKAFSAQNGPKALKLVRANKRVCLVVLDYRMPNTDSVELARKVKRMRPMIPIMMLCDEEVEHRPLQCVDVYVEKGWPTDYFVTLVDTLTKSARSNVSR